MSTATTATRPLTTGHFHVVFGDVKGVFTEVSGLGLTLEVVEHKGSGDKGAEILHRIPGRVVLEPIVLKRGSTGTKEFSKWIMDAKTGAASMRRNGTIMVIDADSSDSAPATTWSITSAWPSKYTSGSLVAGSHDVYVEELSIVYEDISVS